MIIDLERQGDKRMFITEQVESIDVSEHGGWLVRFNTSPRVFQYNKARLLYLKDPKPINIVHRGLYVRNKRISDIAELLCFAYSTYNFYRVTHTNGYVECLDVWWM